VNAPPRILILGAASAIAQAYARLRAAEGCSFVLAGRRADRLATVAADLTARGAAAVESVLLDLGAVDDVDIAAAELRPRLAGVSEILFAYGVLGTADPSDAETVRAVLDVNFTSPALWLVALLREHEPEKSLLVIVIGSVAGERGRAANFVYGAAKSAFATFVEGLMHKYAGSPVRFLLVQPGLGDTPMTESFDKRGLLWAAPERVAADIRRAVARGGRVVYTPWFWRPIMAVIRNLPWFVFRRLKI
jgi:short-subunit dehydrogenase